MKHIIIAENYAECLRYMQRNGISRLDAAFGHGATGVHYDRVVLVGRWWLLPDLRARVEYARCHLNPRPHRNDQVVLRPHFAAHIEWLKRVIDERWRGV